MAAEWVKVSEVCEEVGSHALYTVLGSPCYVAPEVRVRVRVKGQGQG